MNLEKLRAQLAGEEGLRLHAYQDRYGNWTIGYGHNLSAKPISQKAAEQIFNDDIADACLDVAKYLPWATKLEDVRARVFVDLTFNMGIGTVLKFRDFLRFSQAGQWDRAADALMDSKFAYDVGDGPGGRFDRAEQLAWMIRTGRDDADQGRRTADFTPAADPGGTPPPQRR